MADETTSGTTAVDKDDSIFSASWQELGNYAVDFEDSGFSADYNKILSHCKDNNIPQTSDKVAWLAISGFCTTASYAASGQQKLLIQGGNTFEGRNLDDDGTPLASEGPITDPYLLFKFGYYGSAKYRQIRSVIMSALEN